MFNVSQFKNRNLEDVWISLVGADGKPMFYLGDMPKKTAESLKEEIEQFNAGTYDGDALDKYKKPIRLKLKSPHSQAFNKARLARKVKDSMLIQGAAKEVQKSIEDGDALDADSLMDMATSKVCETITSGVSMICELATDWEGFTDGEALAEFDVEILRAILLNPDNLETYTDIIKKIDGKTDFFTE